LGLTTGRGKASTSKRSNPLKRCWVIRKQPAHQRIDVNVEELDQIVDRTRQAPLSESDCHKLKTALHACRALLRTRTRLGQWERALESWMRLAPESHQTTATAHAMTIWLSKDLNPSAPSKTSQESNMRTAIKEQRFALVDKQSVQIVKYQERISLAVYNLLRSCGSLGQPFGCL
jgi:hypothetical protein